MMQEKKYTPLSELSGGSSDKPAKLRIAIQKSGRLYDDSVKLLNECGIELRNVKDRLKTEMTSGRPAMPAEDLPTRRPGR